MPPLTIVTGTYGHTAALKDGKVAPPDAPLRFTEVPVIVRAFRRMVRDLEFDVCEMAFTTYLCARAHGVRFTALPIFLVRGFHHGAIVRRPGGAVTHPKDLEGRRVGVNRGYTVTTGVWARGILQDEYGVDLDRVTWARSSDEHVAEYRPPANVVSLPQGADLAAMVATGELDAAVGIRADAPGVAALIPDAEATALEALRVRGLYPINHLLVVKDEVLAARPELPAALFQAFTEAKRSYVRRLRDGVTDERYSRAMSVLGADPLPYGIAPNRAMIDLLIAHAVRQRILDRPPPPESLFAPQTHDVIG
jgi:4,5-dihydroxyphthalate decarboxylase